MPITGTGWEILIERVREEKRGNRIRTRGKYQVFHDGVAAAGLAGSCVEAKGPGDNSEEDNGKRIEQGRYPLGTHDGARFATIKFAETGRRPAVKLNQTDERTDILIHPASGFKSTIGCINLSRPLANTNADMDPADSRRRVIAVIEDLKSFLGNGFPKKNDQPIARAFAVIEGEPSS
jgi:hypothetical protein